MLICCTFFCILLLRAINLFCKFDDLPQLISSSPLAQSSTWLQTWSMEIQRPLLHSNWSCAHSSSVATTKKPEISWIAMKLTISFLQSTQFINLNLSVTQFCYWIRYFSLNHYFIYLLFIFHSIIIYLFIIYHWFFY